MTFQLDCIGIREQDGQKSGVSVDFRHYPYNNVMYYRAATLSTLWWNFIRKAAMQNQSGCLKTCTGLPENFCTGPKHLVNALSS